jgi:hypothetical protein
MMVVAAGRDERRLGAVALHQLEAEDAAIKGQRPVEIGHLEMDMPDPNTRIDGAGRQSLGSLQWCGG